MNHAGVFQPRDAASINNLDAIARAGGTDQALVIDASGAVKQQFLEGLRNVRDTASPCEIPLAWSRAPLQQGSRSRSAARAERAPSRAQQAARFLDYTRSMDSPFAHVPFLCTLAGTTALVACQRVTAPPAPNPSAPSTATLSATPAPTVASPAQLLRVSRLSAATHAERDHFLYLPAGYADDPGKRWPVMLFLHGDGSRGDAKVELDYIMRNGPLYEAWVQKRDLPFIILAPQLPTYGREAKVEFLKNRSRKDIPVRLEVGVPERPVELATPEPMTGAVSEELPSTSTGYGPELGWPELEADLMALLDDAVQARRGDPTRVYLTGLSYGGFGTWYLASKHPERFAAIVPIVGYGHPELMPAIAAAKLPVWCFAGGRDSSVRVKSFYAGINRLEALGAPELRFTIEEDMGHDVWARVYAGQDVYAWLLAHTKTPSVEAPK